MTPSCLTEDSAWHDFTRRELSWDLNKGRIISPIVSTQPLPVSTTGQGPAPKAPFRFEFDELFALYRWQDTVLPRSTCWLYYRVFTEYTPYANPSYNTFIMIPYIAKSVPLLSGQ